MKNLIPKLPRTRAARRDESEQKLLSAGASLIIQEGFAAVTFDRLAEATGYSRGLAGQKFGSKLGFLLALVEHLTKRLDIVLAERRRPDHIAIDELLDFFDVFITYLDEEPAARSYFVLLASVVSNQLKLREALAERHMDVLTRLVAIIKRGQTDGTIDTSVDAKTIGIIIGCLEIGAANQLLLDPSSFDITLFRRTAHAMIKGFLTPKTA